MEKKGTRVTTVTTKEKRLHEREADTVTKKQQHKKQIGRGGGGGIWGEKRIINRC